MSELTFRGVTPWVNAGTPGASATTVTISAAPEGAQVGDRLVIVLYLTQTSGTTVSASAGSTGRYLGAASYPVSTFSYVLQAHTTSMTSDAFPMAITVHCSGGDVRSGLRARVMAWGPSLPPEEWRGGSNSNNTTTAPAAFGSLYPQDDSTVVMMMAGDSGSIGDPTTADYLNVYQSSVDVPFVVAHRYYADRPVGQTDSGCVWNKDYAMTCVALGLVLLPEPGPGQGSTSGFRYDWDFGDGVTDEDAGPELSHDYTDAGIYQATVTVTGLTV